MTIMDERYATELVTTTGKVYFFDSVECLAAFVLEGIEGREIHSLWVSNFGAPSNLISAQEAFFLRSPNLRSPMGLDLTAFGAPMLERDVLNSFGGDILDWEGVLEFVREKGPSHTGQMGAGAHSPPPGAGAAGG
jgi:copper chaperone NosL